MNARDLRTAAMRQAIDALRHGIAKMNHAGFAVECMPLHEAVDALRAALAAEPQPVYAVTITGRLHETEPLAAAFNLPDGRHTLYTAVPTAQPLTDEQLLDIARQEAVDYTIKLARDVGPYEVTQITHVYRQIARAIERAHGIGDAP